MSEKECTKCNEVKPFADYYKMKNGKHGLQAKCKECQKQRSHSSYHADRQAGMKYRREYYAANKDELLARSKEYNAANKDRTNARLKERYDTDPAWRAVCRLRGRLRGALNGTAKAASTMELVGCDRDHLLFHLESQFTEGMTWDNIHIDHIQPCASFDLTDPDEQRKCFHYTNLQPLFAEDNLKKSDTIPTEHQVNLL